MQFRGNGLAKSCPAEVFLERLWCFSRLGIPGVVSTKQQWLHRWSQVVRPDRASTESLHLSIDLVITSEGAESRCFVLPKKPRDHQISMSAYPPHSHRMRPRSSLNEEVTAVSLLLPARPSWYSSNVLGSLVGDQGGRADRNCMKL